MNAIIDNWISYGLVKAIYHTLLHSLWQGVLMATVAGMVLVATKRANATWRYNLLVGTLGLFVLSVLITFLQQLSQPVESSVGSPIGTAVSITNNHSLIIQTDPIRFVDRSITFLDQHLSWIVALWFLMICVKSAHLGVGLSGTIRLKKQRIFPISSHWEQRFRQLALRVGLSPTIQLWQSGLVKVPITFGYVKPIVLVPVGLLTALPPDQVEAILLHELAHIRRSDYAVNLIQCLIEILFFFNPAVRWVSSLIRTERENCCDDLASHWLSSKRSYIQALILFEELQFPLPTYSLAINGSTHPLLNRANRLLSNQNKTLNPMEKMTLIASLLLTGLLMVACGQLEQTKNRFITVPTTLPTRRAQPMTDSSALIAITNPVDSFPQYVTLNSTINGKKYRLKTDSQQVTELSIDGVPVSSNKIGQYKPVTDRMIRNFTQEVARINAQIAQQATQIDSMRKSIQASEQALRNQMEQNRKKSKGSIQS